MDGGIDEGVATGRPCAVTESSIQPIGFDVIVFGMAARSLMAGVVPMECAIIDSASRHGRDQAS